MAYEKIMAPVGEKLAALLGMGPYLDYLKDLRIVMVLVALACFLSALALLLLTRSHCKLRSKVGLTRPEPDPEKTL